MDFTAIIVAVLSLIGTLGGSLGGIIVSSKLTAYRIQKLEEKITVLDDFAQRIPLIEHRIDNVEQEVDELKQYHKGH